MCCSETSQRLTKPAIASSYNASRPETSGAFVRVRGNTLVERRALGRRREFDRFVAGLVSQAQQDGDVRTDFDAVVTARLLFGLVNSLSEWVRPRTRRGDDALIDAVCTIIFHGLRTSAHAPDTAQANGQSA